MAGGKIAALPLFLAGAAYLSEEAHDAKAQAKKGRKRSSRR
jgi:hypothetical protein